MLDGIDALVALESCGTVSEAATRLRLTQSAVSKRIQALQATLGLQLIEPDGRRVRLTPQAVALLERARPLVAELRSLARPLERESRSSFALALADSVASSWGPAVVRRALDALPNTQVALHAHRSVLVIESVRLGRYDAGLCTEPRPVTDLVCHPLVEEPMVIVHSDLARRVARSRPLITIEPSSATWRAVQPLLAIHHPRLLANELVFVESFGAVFQMVRAGFGNGLLPLGLARELRVPRSAHRELPGVARRVVLLSRKTVHQLPGFAALREQLTLAGTRHFGARSA